ncbi:MAG: diaminopimelate epimerase [Candidatus Azobacteroides sp.]|nr:diaminopimelate epimerase [Candidatus Azobacteroides sp.]
MDFVKMHGSGNDYVYIDCFKEKIEDPSEFAKRVSERHTGIGSDGLVLILPSERCDFQMRMFNADGSEAQMCGNASRCVGKYVFDYGLTTKQDITLETKAGVKKLHLFPENGKIKKVTVDMGEPILEAKMIPVNLPQKNIINYPFDFSFAKYSITAVSMGNPHVIIFIEEDVDAFPLEEIGPKIEVHPVFPEKINVEVVNILSDTHIKMRVWERGTGETQACGTGACAVLVASVLNKRVKNKAIVSLPGGDLEIEWNADDNRVYMTGDAVTVFEGKLIG